MSDISLENSNKKLQSANCGIYVHIPFCRKRCIYCDFYTEGVVRANWPRMVDALLVELRERMGDFHKARRFTIYIGGGTPSLMPTDEMERLVVGVRSMLPDAAEVTECTIEVNPEDVTEQKSRAWHEMGFNRVSMGVQTLNDDELHMIGRGHSAVQAEEAFEMLRPYFKNISLDLIFGLPGSRMANLEETVARFMALRPEHISAYSLMYEEKTALTHLRNQGRVEEYPEEGSVEMFRRLSAMLAEAGYARYEISNYALPGFESRHNSAYWRGVPYIGIGPSAHSYDGGSVRRWNVASVAKYIDGIESGKPDYEEEHLTITEQREERIMTALRTAAGINLDEFASMFGDEEKEKLLRDARSNIRGGSLELHEGCLRLTEKGVMISDDVISDLF